MQFILVTNMQYLNIIYNELKATEMRKSKFTADVRNELIMFELINELQILGFAQ